MKRILLSLLILLGVGAGMTSATKAYFTMGANSFNNQFETGTMVMSFQDYITYDASVAEGPQQDVHNSYGGLNLKPGEDLPEQTVRFLNLGSLDGNHLDLFFGTTAQGVGDLADYIIVESLLFGPTKEDSVDLRAQLIDPTTAASDPEYLLFEKNATALLSSDTNHDGVLTLKELANNGYTRIEPGTQTAGINAGEAANLWLDTKVDSALAQQGMGTDFHMGVLIQQVASQL